MITMEDIKDLTETLDSIRGGFASMLNDVDALELKLSELHLRQLESSDPELRSRRPHLDLVRH